MRNSVASTFAMLNDYNAQAVAAGLCRDCGRQRGADGTTVRCRPCANRVNEKTKQHKKKRQQ